MANEVLLKVGTQLCFANHAGDFSPAAGTSLEVGTPTDVELVLAALAAGAAANSSKFDFGATWARQYSVQGVIEYFSAPTAGGTIDLYISPSPQSTAANANAGGADGVAGAWTGDGGGTVAETVRQLQYIGQFVVTDLSGIQQMMVQEPFTPLQRYGQLIVVNNTSVNIANTDDVETHIVFTPIKDEVQ